MPIKIKPPIKKDFQLVKSDQEFENSDGATMITVRQATQGDYEQVNDLTAEYKRSFNGREVVAIQRISFDDVRRKEVFLTLCSSNLVDEDGTPLFRFAHGRLEDEAAFLSAWRKLPPVVADEIYEFVLEMNPLWDDRVPRPAPTQPEQSGEAE